jgi:hypothetical protein
MVDAWNTFGVVVESQGRFDNFTLQALTNDLRRSYHGIPTQTSKSLNHRYTTSHRTTT